MKIYKNRVFDGILREALDAKGAVLIEGAKWCGKTTTAEQIAKSVIYLNNPKFRDQYLMTAQTNPQRLLEDRLPRPISHYRQRRAARARLVHQLPRPSRNFLHHPRREGDRQAAGNGAMSAAGGESRKPLKNGPFVRSVPQV